MPENKLKNYLLLHFIVFIWGFTAILGKLISIDAIPLVWYRMSLSVVFIGIYFIWKKKSLKISKKAAFKFFLTGTIIALHWITFFKAIKVSNVSVALVTMSTGAFFASFIEPFFFKRKIKGLEILLGLFVILGLYIIFNFESEYYLGIIYALISSFLAALFSVLNGVFIKTHQAAIISFYQLFFGAVFITIFLLFTNGFSDAFFSIPSSDWIYLLILSSVCTAYAFIVAVDILKVISPYTVVLTVNLEPIYAIILALIFFGESEQMNPEFYFGALIVFLVVMLNGLIKNRQKIKERFSKKKTHKIVSELHQQEKL